MSDFEVHPVGTARELNCLRALRDQLRNSDPEEFELLCAELMRRAELAPEDYRRLVDEAAPA